MRNNIAIGQFLPGDSYLHKLDPRTKFVAFISLVVMVFQTHNIQNYIMLAGLAIVIAVLSRIGFYTVVKGLKPFMVIIILSVMLQLFFIPGKPIFITKFFSISMEGIINALVIGYRLILVIVITNYLTVTTSPVALTDGLEKIFRPLGHFKVPVSELALMITITLRFIPTLLEEAEKIIKAQASRGAEFESGSILKRSKNIVSLLVPLLVSAIKRAEELATAMESRGYSSGQTRTRMNPLWFKKIDYIAITIMVICIFIFYII